MKQLFFLLLSGASCTLWGQQIERYVLATAGNAAMTGYIHLSYTIGEPAVTTATDGNMVLTQGFQQPGDIVIGIEDHPENEVHYSLFPNPTAGDSYLEITGTFRGNATISLVDALGRILLKVSCTKVAEHLLVDLPVRHIAASIYWITVSWAGDAPARVIPLQILR